MKLRAGKTILRANVVMGVAAFVTLIVSIVAPAWAFIPAAVGAIAAVVLLRAHVSLARIFAEANRADEIADELLAPSSRIEAVRRRRPRR